MTMIHEKLENVRKPRVHIKYDIETEGASEQKELPFVVGVMGDFSGNQPAKEKKPLKDRKFIQIDPDNFDSVMQKISPGIQIQVDNTLTNDDRKLAVNLNFNSMNDFEPNQIVNQVDSLRNLKQIRDKFRDLLTKLDRSEDLEELLENTLKNNSQLELLGQQLSLTDQNQTQEVQQ